MIQATRIGVWLSRRSTLPWAEAGTGAVATQANVNVGYGPRGLDLLRQGPEAKDVLAGLLVKVGQRPDGRDECEERPGQPQPNHAENQDSNVMRIYFVRAQEPSNESAAPGLEADITSYRFPGISARATQHRCSDQ